MDHETAVDQFLGERPRAEQLRDWRQTLEDRLKALQAEAKAGRGASLETKIAQLKRQIQALREEEAVTQFVEDSVRVTLAMGAATEGMDDQEEQ